MAALRKYTIANLPCCYMWTCDKVLAYGTWEKKRYEQVRTRGHILKRKKYAFFLCPSFFSLIDEGNPDVIARTYVPILGHISQVVS